MTEALQGWHPDPFGRHEMRYFSAGRPTYLVRDGRVEGSDPVEDIPPQAEPGFTPAPEWSAPAPEWSAPAPAWSAPEALPPSFQQPEPDPYTSAYAPPPRPPAAQAPRTSVRHSARGRRGRVPMVAAAAVVVVVVVVALAVSRHPRSSTANVSSDTGATPSGSFLMPVSGVTAASNGGHFTATFPSTPFQESVNEDISGVQATVRLAVVQTPVTEVVEEDLSIPIPTDREPAVLRAAIAVAVAAVTDGAPTTQSDTTFRGHGARTSTFTTPAGVQVTAIAFFHDPTTVYFLLAGAGAPFQALSSSVEFGAASSPQVIS